jgi:hypothetical protein
MPTGGCSSIFKRGKAGRDEMGNCHEESCVEAAGFVRVRPARLQQIRRGASAQEARGHSPDGPQPDSDGYAARPAGRQTGADPQRGAVGTVRHAGARLAMLTVSGVGADAEAALRRQPRCDDYGQVITWRCNRLVGECPQSGQPAIEPRRPHCLAPRTRAQRRG